MCLPTALRPAATTEQVQELELSVDLRSLDKLLDFLSCSFMGGTDVDKPLQLSLERLQKDEWQQVRRGLFGCCAVQQLLAGRRELAWDCASARQSYSCLLWRAAVLWPPAAYHLTARAVLGCAVLTARAVLGCAVLC